MLVSKNFVASEGMMNTRLLKRSFSSDRTTIFPFFVPILQ